MLTFNWEEMILVISSITPTLSVPSIINELINWTFDSEYQLAFITLYAYFDNNSGEFLQLVLWTLIPSFTDIKPKISSPGIGLQHLDNEYWILSLFPWNSINLDFSSLVFLSTLDLSISISIILFFDLSLRVCRWSKYSLILLRLNVPLAISK